MKWFALLLVIVAQLFGAACSSSQQAQTVVQRQPLEKHAHEYQTPVNYQPRVLRYDEKTGEAITYDHKPRVELLDAKSGKYAFRWIGFDGKEKTATFNRADAVDVVLSASVSKTPSGEYLYTYEVRNLPSSGAYLKRFILQNFALDVKPEKSGDFMPGLMSKEIRNYSEGNWLDFADVSDGVQVDPGQTVTTHLISSAPPGLVRCHAGAQTVVEGAGEEMLDDSKDDAQQGVKKDGLGADEEIPQDLQALLQGYNEYPHGYTVGPDERLKNLSRDERAKYVLDKLPQFQKLGWMTEEASRFYEQTLKSGDFGRLSQRAEQDLKEQQITPEVFAVLQAMK